MEKLLFGKDVGVPWGLRLLLSHLCEQFHSELLLTTRGCRLTPHPTTHSHATEVMETPAWKSMITSHPHLIAEAFRALATQQVPPINTTRKRIKTSQ